MSLAPFALAYAIVYYEQGHRTLEAKDLLGSGQGLLTALGMFVVSLNQLQGARRFRTAFSDGLAAGAVFALIALAVTYGVVTNDLVAHRTQSPQQARDLANFSLLFILLGVLAATFSHFYASLSEARVRRLGGGS